MPILDEPSHQNLVVKGEPPRQKFWCGGKKEKLALIFVGLLILLNIFAWQRVFDLVGNQYLEVNFFNVGQGDAIFVETPQKHQILIDGGPDSSILEKLAKELPFWDRSIDVIILTHPERDHLAGLIEVLKRYKVDYILWTGVVRETSENDKWRNLLKEEKGEIVIVKAGQKMKAGEVWFNILSPAESLERKEFKNSNDTSVVFRLVFKQNSFLFTGDTSSLIEKELIEQRVNLISDVLKVGHHGSKYSTSNSFLEVVNPGVAVIQVGKNSYGHPTEEVLQRLKNFDIEILRTDKDGDIKIVSDGNKFKIKDKK